MGRVESWVIEPYLTVMSHWISYLWGVESRHVSALNTISKAVPCSTASPSGMLWPWIHWAPHRQPQQKRTRFGQISIVSCDQFCLNFLSFINSPLWIIEHYLLIIKHDWSSKGLAREIAARHVPQKPVLILQNDFHGKSVLAHMYTVSILSPVTRQVDVLPLWGDPWPWCTSGVSSSWYTEIRWKGHCWSHVSVTDLDLATGMVADCGWTMELHGTATFPGIKGNATDSLGNPHGSCCHWPITAQSWQPNGLVQIDSLDCT